MKKYIKPITEIDETLDFEDLLQGLTVSEDGNPGGPTPGGPSLGGGGDAHRRNGSDDSQEWKDGLW